MEEAEKQQLSEEARKALEEFNRKLDEAYEREKKFYTFMHTWGMWILGFLSGLFIGWLYLG